ncbi:MAG: CinA family protein, partial [Rhodocyclaceae bacterium]|nr:CinA family protein [Rhodocyclaceae bacterium]
MSAETVLPAPLVALAAEIGRYLQQQQQVLACAESCTGGLVASALTAIAGSSAWFSCGWVTYANAAKTRQLHVPEALLDEQGAVSEAVARAMAEGALRQADADVALAISGIA